MEYGFELALCGAVEAREEWVLARQLGGAAATPGARVIDVVAVVPGPAFEERAAITPATIPAAALAADAGQGEAVPAVDAVPGSPERVRSVVDRAVEIGFFEAERRGGRRYVRRAARYPEEWFDRLVAIENKPDLGRPGDLQRQLRFDASLALFDEVWLATASHVTGAHRNRLPEEVGLLRFDPGERRPDGDEARVDPDAIEVLREPEALPVDEPGIEIGDRERSRRAIEVVDAETKARKRRRIAERAYGKGWRPAPPGCAHAAVTADGRPDCQAFGRIVDPAVDCRDCEAREDAPPPADEAALDALRAERTPWVADPEGRARRQAGLDRFG